MLAPYFAQNAINIKVRQHLLGGGPGEGAVSGEVDVVGADNGVERIVMVVLNVTPSELRASEISVRKNSSPVGSVMSSVL